MDAPKQFYSLQLPGKSLTKAPPGNTVEVKRAPSAEQIIFVRNNRALLIYERMGGSWSEVHKRNNFFAVSNDDASYPWAVYDDGLLAVRKVKGFVLYRWNKKELNELLVAAKYHDEYGYALSNNTILFGNIYPSAEYIGVISRLHSVVEFSSAKPSDPRKRVRPLKKQLDLEAAWMQPSSTISLVERYDNNAQLSIALRTAAELKLFRFDNQYQLKELATVKDFLPLDDEYDRIMFAKFDDANINDLLHFTTKGLTMYRFFEESGVFEKVYYSTAFSKLRGWNRRTIESIATVNIDGDKWDELIASGPRGLCLYRPVFGNDGFELVNIFDETIEDGEMRYGIPKLTTKLADSDGFNVLLFTGANLVSVQTKPYIPRIYDVPSAAQTVVKANAVAPLLVPQKKYIVWLHDQLDLNSMLQPLNPHAGTVELSIPLIELPNAFGVSVRKYVQYKNIPFESFFGRGWSLPLDYISVERKNSAFLQDHDYAVLKNNNRIILKRYPHLDSVDCWSFEIDGFKQATIKYYPSKERWEMTMEDRTFVYGAWENLSKRREEDVCASWPLCGEKSANERKLPSRWYLVHEESKYGAYANYYYDPLVEGKGDRLARIELSSGSSVSFKYSEQNKLVNFKVNTTCYEQNVSFEYEGNWLKQINQEDRPLFKFDYKDDRMWKIVYPNRLESMLEYSDVQIDRTRFEEAVPVDLNPTIYYGPDYTVILDKEFEDDRVAITIRNLLGGTDGPKAMKEKLHFGQPGIKSHTIHALEDMLVVVLIYGSQKEVTVLQFTGKDWVEKEYISDFPLDAVISVGKKFVVLCDLKTLRVLTINHKGNLNDTEVQKSLPPKFLIHTFGNGFLMCSASSIDVWTMGIKNEWQKGSTQAPTNIFTDIDKLLNAFVLDAEFSIALRKGFLADAVTVYQNAIVIRVPVLDGQKLNLKVFFLIMNYDRGATQVSKQTVQIPIANFDTYEYDMPTKDGDVFKLHYKVQNNKYVLKLKSMKGPLNNSLTEQKQKSYKQIDASGEAVEKKAQYKKEVDEKFAEEVDNISQTVVSKAQFAMDLSQFGVLTNQHGVVTGNVQLSFDGQTWQQQPIDPATMRMEKVDQPLGAGFKLAKYSYQDTFKVYEMPRHAVVYDTQTNNPQEIQVVAPRYIQSQPAGKQLSMFFFHTKETIQQPANVTMVRASNTISLVTVRHVNETSKFVVFRPVDSFLLKMTSLFTKQRVRLDQDELRTSSYNYHPRDVHLSSEGAMFYRVKVAPGDNEKRFGWYEQATNSSTGATTKKSFAADGTDVTVREKPKQESNRDADVKDLERTIWDRSKQLKIIDLGALKLADEVASYYGFEAYELNRYGVDKEWSFNLADVQFERDNHYLKLPASSTLKATFTPTEPKNVWIVSFWVRIGNGEMVPKVDDMLNVLMVELVNLNNQKRVQLTGAKVHHIMSNWCYVEMTIDTTHTADGSKLSFNITIKPSESHTSIDVDHVRFSPLNLNFRANVYTPDTAEVRATLCNNGLLKQNLYSPTGKRVALLSEDGQVVDFAMHSKTAFVASVNARQCLIEMKPNYGTFETFEPSYWKQGSTEWSIRYGEVEYNPGSVAQRGELSRTFDRPFESVALRFVYNTSVDDSKLSFSWNGQEFNLFCSTGSSNSCNRPPKAGEVLIFITELRVSVWLEGHLLSETLIKPDSRAQALKEFRLLPTGSIKIAEFLVMYDARVKVTYHNRMGRPVQVVVYDDPRTVRVREIIYDEIDRPIMQTKWTKLTSHLKEYFAFYENFITQVHGTSHVMSGMVAKAHPSCEGFPYSRTIYANDPTENKQYQGLPGKEYTVLGKYKRRYAMRPEIKVLANIFPVAEGYRQSIVERPGGAIRATVEDKRGNKVAKYWQVGNYEHRLTTYTYSETYGHLIEVLPPQFHALAKTTSRTRPFLTGGNTQEEIKLRNLWRVSYEYDYGNLIGKRTPDGGTYEYIYSESGILRFSIHYNAPERVNMDRVVHFTYSSHGKVMREALVNLTRESCYQIVKTNEVPESTDLIESFYGEVESNPDVRYRSQQSTRKIGKNQMMESLIFDENEQVIKKVFFVPTINRTYSIDYEYENGKLHSLRYPMDSAASSFTLIYDYNKNGEVKSIKESTKRVPMFEFSYNADGMVETMNVRTDPTHTFQRNFTYNEPGFLIKLADNYLTESVSYLETDSYGQDSYTPIYEGLISKTLFTAHWQKATSPLRNGIYTEYLMSDNMKRAQASLCLEVLKRTGYIDENNLVNRTLYGDMNDDLPFVCGKRLALNHLSKVLSTRSFPYQYGHRYDYDDHDQLIKAKYFHGLEELKLAPLTHHTFHKEIKGIDEAKSKNIWDALREKSFLTTDCTNPSLCHGREGTKSIFNDFIHQHRYSHHLKLMLSKAISARKGLDVKTFEEKCTRWIEGSNMILKACTNLKEEMMKQKLFGESADAPVASLNEAFKKALQRYKSNVPDIVGVLNHHFMTALGRSAGDVQSYEIDANGNHRKFYTGFSRYRLEYQEGTNKITKLYRQQFDRAQGGREEFTMAHDSDGAVIQAEHKGIKHMAYDKLLQRVSEIEMTDGRKILYQYDVRAERTFKQVRGKDGKVMSEKYYIRDANGLVLMDMDMSYLASDQPPDVRVTSYIYKDQQLIGFVRNDKLYGVITDHEGSVRLVVREGEVVAAYDYLPYGQIFRRFGTDLDGQISYLYTGQEWEPETGLYNYRARLYDPDIGRFYQMDPKEQYPSPYVYAGNSPVSLIDPDGEFAFTLAVLILALVGAYLGAASANNCWNPLKWDWRSSSTWIGLLTGAVTGASIPFNMASSVAFFVGMGLSLSTSIAIMVGTGITFAYFMMAASSGTWDPTKFDYSSPGTWNALMNGVATSSWILMNPSSLISSFVSITSVAAKALFFVAKLTMSLGFTYLFAALGQGGEFDMTKWDYSDPALYMSFVDGFTTATVGVLFLRNLPRQISKWSGKVKRTVDIFVANMITFRAQLALGRDWSRLIMHTKNFLYVGVRNLQTLQKGFLTVGFYSLIVSLRMSLISESAIPEFTAAEASINVLFSTEQFSDFIVKPLSKASPKLRLPKPPNLARMLRFRIRSDAIRIGSNESIVLPNHMERSSASSLHNMFNNWIKLPFEWLFSTSMHENEDVFDKRVSMISAPTRNMAKSAFALRNCYKIYSEEHLDGMISCFGHSSTVTIIPKFESNPRIENADHYKYCMPLTYDGHPSASCEGEWSSLVYTAKETARVFDFVDGWILLAQVAPIAWKEIKLGFKYIFSRPKRDHQVPHTDMVEYEKKMLYCRLDQMKTQINTHQQLSWAQWTYEDLAEDVEVYLSKGQGSMNLLEERINALEAEIREDFILQRLQSVLREHCATDSSVHVRRNANSKIDFLYAGQTNSHKVQNVVSAFDLLGDNVKFNAILQSKSN
uniref:Tox-SGS domain-containing protein n=1 Tax=Anopheles coluzzii TaxID=1518534 RepID=A0A6E8VZ01_ANOCL